MRRRVALSAAAIVLVSGCAQRHGPEGSPNEGPDPATSRTVSIYEAVVRQLVTTADSTFGPNPQFPAIYLLDQTKPAAGDPESLETQGTPLPEDVKRGLLDALSDLPVELVSDEESLITPIEDGGGVKRDGVVVTVGPIPEGDEQVEVQASLYAGNLAATWLTYVVKRSSQGWRVTGTKGPVAIS